MILIALSLCSCTYRYKQYPAITTKFVVVKIEPIKIKRMCSYLVELLGPKYLNTPKGWLVDTNGKFNINDTLYLQRK